MQLVGQRPFRSVDVLEVVEPERVTGWRARLAFWLIRLAARLVGFKLRVVRDVEEIHERT